MWIYTPFGFYSVVQKPGDEDLTVRARVGKDLDELRARYMPDLGPTQITPGHDYPCRAKASHAALAAGMVKLTLDLNYSNVKAQTYKVGGASREAIYHEVHSATTKLHKLKKREALRAGVARIKDKAAAGKLRPAYGGVVVDGKGRLLLAEPKDHFDGTVWTWPKGRPEAGESAEQAAVREVEEETGVYAEAISQIAGLYPGSVTTTSYFLMKKLSDGGHFCEETASVRWASVSEAAELLSESPKKSARERNLQVLAEAQAKAADLGLGLKA